MMNLKKTVAVSVAVAAIAVAGLAAGVTAGDGPAMENDSMVGLPAALVGTTAPIRGVNGGGLPWTIGASSVELKASGKVEVAFDNLVFAAGPNLGKNTVASMKVVVSCLTETGAVVNVSTPAFPVSVATATDVGGDGMIEAKVALPATCIAPIVFVTTPTDRWLAVNGL
jgi:hypothetical protein